ncbi:PAS domain S-box protein [Rubrivivax sp. RP6-9]|uniref:PAS domain-containing hybrid sensor histidine kinase/response regulator n=1 Tax=Rubrivivax sp. RP6-9 TaxID=3415750 RepID=UPI003CC5F885
MYETSPNNTALHPQPPAPPARAVDTRRDVQALIARAFFVAAAGVSALSALLMLLLPPERAGGGAAGPMAGMLGLALLALACLRLPAPRVGAGMFAVLALGVVLTGAVSLHLGWGIAWPGHALYGIFVCILCTSSHRRAGLSLALLAALMLAGVYQFAPPLGVARVPGDLLRLVVLLITVGVGLASGLLIAHVVQRYVRSADDREQRFRGLLAVAADAYWEIDHQYRMVTANDQRHKGRALSLAAGLGQVPWELPQFGCDPETLDLLLTDLDTRVPFRDRLVHWTSAGGRQLGFVISGEPRFDQRGVFKGYWGVARNVTDDLAARQALQATETRYQELFARIPTPLVLHRDGRVIDANPAALDMFGHDTLEAFRGRDLLASYESGDSRERARRRLEELNLQPLGTALPVTDFRLQPRTGRRLAVRGTGVRVAAPGGPATLSIYVDDTERRTAEEAVRRSEALLQHLVATSPDVITLTDLVTGRYAMVNRTFEKLTGFTAAEVVGRTSMEIGIWHDAASRQHIVAEVQRLGHVSEVPARFNTKQGGVVSMLVSAGRFVMDRREYLVVNARDVTETERTRLEREAILANASIGIAVTRNSRFVLANPCFEQMLRWPPGGLVDQPGSAVWRDADAYAEIGRTIGPPLARGEQVELERPVTRRDGSTFLARMLARAIDPTHPAAGGTIWIVEDVTERRQFEGALAAARDAAEAASRAKSAFLANTSHELRTPLNGMLHLAQMARDPALDGERRQQYLEQIADSAQNLATIISDILDLSKIEAGHLDLERMPFDLGALLRTVQRGYATLAAARDLPLTLELGPGVDGGALGDALRVRQILSNYLSNALKFTAAGSVQLQAWRSGDQVRFEVHDTGPGIDDATQARLFHPFTQADQSTTRRFGGTGLGLSICRELAQLMGGTVGVRSRFGAGSVFWADLPLPACPAPAALAHDGSAAGALQLRGVRVLMAEDNPVNMLIAVALLERWGVQVEQASDGRLAVEAVERAHAAGHPFDAVLMDVQMPVMSGHEATRMLRERDSGRHLPIIALTAAALVSERQAAIGAGMDDFLTKPIDADRLRETLRRWVRRAAVAD